jgi:uncharacterized protein YllA (UPF0747 family)
LIATVMPNLDPESVAAARAEQERRLTAGGYGESPEAPFAPGGTPVGNGDALETLSTPLIMQNLMFPVAADVIDESEAYAFAREQALFGELGIDAPLAWPRGSAVLVDARSRKVLAKYGVGIQDLFSGAETVTARLRSDAAFEETAARMEELEKEIAGRLQSLCGPGQEDRRMAGEIDKARRRILYQLDNLKKRASAARARRGEAVARQISGVCWRIAPWGKLQEREYAALQFLMQHPSLPGILRRGIDPFTFEHQLISIG